jgi:hypothetical protein
MVTAVERSAVADAAGGMHGFPGALTSFVGRAAVVDEIAGQLGQYRLVTVTGSGGAGKTRLAGEVAKQVAGRFADGVWLAELAAVRDPAQVAAAVAAALGIRDLPAVAAADALAHALARRQLLLVLDNCEQVIGAAAELCGRLLLGADDVRVLATSREPLRIAGESRYRLAPHVRVAVVMPGHVGTDIIANSLRARGLPEPEHMSDAQVEELIPRDVQAGLIRAGLLGEGASADELRQMLVRANADFRDKAPVSAAEAATIILDGVRSGAWRILIGEDAKMIDAAVRAKPEAAYDYAELFSALAEEPTAGTP